MKCQQLQVGDIIVSLKPCNKSEKPPASTSSNYFCYENTMNNNRDLPQNLSRRPQTIPTTATATAVSSRQAPPLDVPLPSSHHPLLPYTNHLLEMQRNVANFSVPQLIESHHNTSNGHHRPLSHENPSLQSQYANLFAIHEATSQSQQQMAMPMVHKSISQLSEEESIASRKRRWSAPDDYGNDELEEQRNALLRGKYSH